MRYSVILLSSVLSVLSYSVQWCRWNGFLLNAVLSPSVQSYPPICNVILLGALLSSSKVLSSLIVLSSSVQCYPPQCSVILLNAVLPSSVECYPPQCSVILLISVILFSAVFSSSKMFSSAVQHHKVFQCATCQNCSILPWLRSRAVDR